MCRRRGEGAIVETAAVIAGRGVMTSEDSDHDKRSSKQPVLTQVQLFFY